MSIFEDNEILVGNDGNRYKVMKHYNDYPPCDRCCIFSMRKNDLPCSVILPNLFDKEFKRKAYFLKKKSCKILFGNKFLVRLEKFDSKWNQLLNKKGGSK